MPVIGFLVGAVICSLPYLLYSAEFPPLLVTAIALLLASTGLAIVRPADQWWSGLGVGAGILVPMAAIIGIDLLRDPTSHNLFPFEIAFGLFFAMSAALVGALLGGFIGRQGLVPALTGAAVTAIGVVTAAIHVPFVFAERTAVETEARTKLQALVAAQNRFHASSRRSDYTCNLKELGQTFDTPVQWHERSRPVEGMYRGGTWAAAGDYEFMLLCRHWARRSDRFRLAAAPVRGTLGRWAYCAEADGEIRQMNRGRYNSYSCPPDEERRPTR